jgi:hypothetical protein
MRFHLPAYLVADLEGNLQTADVLFHLVYMANDAASRFDTLSPAQRVAVREFLLVRLSDPTREFVHPLVETALRDYWTAHKELSVPGAGAAGGLGDMEGSRRKCECPPVLSQSKDSASRLNGNNRTPRLCALEAAS